MNKKVIYPIVNIALTVVFFLVLFIIALVKSIEWNSYGMYGASSFAPLIAVIIFAAIIIGIQTAVLMTSKKKGKTGTALAVKMMVIPLAVIVGIFGILDIAMPPILTDATSGTILYEDVVYDWQGMHDKLYERVELFKEKNGLDESVKYTDAEFQDIFRPLFTSMDAAYKGFNPLAISMALDSDDMVAALLNGNFPLSVAATLLLDTTDEINGYDQTLTIDEILEKNIGKVITAVIDVVAEIGGDFGKLDNATINDALNEILYTQSHATGDDADAVTIEWNIFNILGSNMLFSEIDPNAHITGTRINEFGEIETVDMGACLGYQDMAWLDGIPLMFFIPLMSVRDIFYLFAALIGIASAAQIFIAGAYSKNYGTKFSFFMVRPETI